MVTMLYPERRRVTAEQILGWYRDRLCDDAIASFRSRLDREPTDQELDALVQDTLHREAETPVETAIRYLEDVGVATFQRGTDR